MKKKSITRITICGRAGRVMVAISIEVTFCCLLVYCCCCLVYICTNCWSVGIGTGYKLFLHRNATNHLSDHSVSSTQSSLWVWSWYLAALLIFCSSDSQEHKYRLLVTSGLMFFFCSLLLAYHSGCSWYYSCCTDTQFFRDHSTQCKYYIQQLSQ